MTERIAVDGRAWHDALSVQSAEELGDAHVLGTARVFCDDLFYVFAHGATQLDVVHSVVARQRLLPHDLASVPPEGGAHLEHRLECSSNLFADWQCWVALDKGEGYL
jgi:hypothetical protein